MTLRDLGDHAVAMGKGQREKDRRQMQNMRSEGKYSLTRESWLKKTGLESEAKEAQNHKRTNHDGYSKHTQAVSHMSEPWCIPKQNRL